MHHDIFTIKYIKHTSPQLPCTAVRTQSKPDNLYISAAAARCTGAQRASHFLPSMMERRYIAEEAPDIIIKPMEHESVNSDSDTDTDDEVEDTSWGLAHPPPAHLLEDLTI